MSGDADEGECHACDTNVIVDGEEAIRRFGEILCRDCSGNPVAFRAECTAGLCGWSFEEDGTEFNRGHIKMRAQQEANSHENTKRVFDGEHVHDTTVSEVAT